MMTVGLLARLKAKPGKEGQLKELLRGAEGLARREPKTEAWFAFETPDHQCWIFDAFADETGRKAHLDGEIAKALMKSAPDLLAEAPDIKQVTLYGSKVPSP